MTTCEVSCQNCEGACMVDCQVSCQIYCQKYCQNCEGIPCQTCQSSCQLYCQGCQTTCEIYSQRPDSWSWTSTVSKGSKASNGTVAYLTAKEWNDFTARINEFRAYKGLSTYSFTTVKQGGNMMASQVNQAVTAISAMSPPTATPATVSAGQQVTAAFINGLSASLNSIV